MQSDTASIFQNLTTAMTSVELADGGYIHKTGFWV